MRKFVVTTVTMAALTGAALGLAEPAAAVPDAGSAADTVANLKAQGYNNVQINGSTPVPLSQCSVTGIHPSLNDSDTLQERQHTLVTVDVSCPSDSD